MFTNGENHRGKTPSSDFKVTAPKNSLLSKQVIISKRKLFAHIYLFGQVIKSIFNKVVYTYPDLFCLIFPEEEEGYSVILKTKKTGNVKEVNKSCSQEVKIAV